MKANELRIGNYIKQKSHPTKYTITAITKYGGWIELTDGFEECDSDIDSIEPIPLTEEILLKCGLTKYDIKDYIFLDTGFNLTDYNDGNGYRLTFEDCDKSIEIKYLHQLQNLYFALTGEELTVNL